MKNDPERLFGDSREPAVTFIQEDTYIKGQYLALQGHALIQINTEENLTSLLAGSISEEGFVDEIGKNARFHGLRSFLQLDSTENILVTDGGNRCLRIIDKTNFNVSSHSWKCSQIGANNDTHDGTFAEVEYSDP